MTNRPIKETKLTPERRAKAGRCDKGAYHVGYAYEVGNEKDEARALAYVQETADEHELTVVDVEVASVTFGGCKHDEPRPAREGMCIVCRYSKAKQFPEGWFHTPEGEDHWNQKGCRSRYENALKELRQRYGYMDDERRAEFLEKFPDYNPLANVGYGWWGILVNLVEILLKVDPDFHVNQIKEKFGGLRFYTGPMSELGYTIEDWGEQMSYSYCEVCGEFGKSRDGGWIKTLCDFHHYERENKHRDREAEYAASMKALLGEGHEDASLDDRLDAHR